MNIEIISIEEWPLPIPTREQFLSQASIRFLVFWRDGFRCVYCGASQIEVPKIRLNVDHLIPKSAGGKFTFDNLVTACAQCNVGKSDTYLPEPILNLIRTIMAQNNSRFLEMTDRNMRCRIEERTGQSLHKTKVVVRLDSQEFYISGWRMGEFDLKSVNSDRTIRLLADHPDWVHCARSDESMCPVCALDIILLERGVDFFVFTPWTDECSAPPEALP
ncbi:MAG: HNH endonuclease [Candidatus Sungbacteria bacterium]|nr:HNH endonuclease [Candidatus Sungbacteria bacterium]